MVFLFTKTEWSYHSPFVQKYSLHVAHQGIILMTASAESSVCWSGITSAIASTRINCNHCNRIAPSQPNAPLIPPTLPSYPFQCICADFSIFKGTHYLCIIDRYSNWPIIEKTRCNFCNIQYFGWTSIRWWSRIYIQRNSEAGMGLTRDKKNGKHILL